MRDLVIRGCSSAGRAPDLHSGGRRFDSCQLHQEPLTPSKKSRIKLKKTFTKLVDIRIGDRHKRPSPAKETLLKLVVL